MQKHNIGFIGLGNMGENMLCSLANRHREYGHEYYVYDIVDKVAAIKERVPGISITMTKNPAEVAAHCDVIFTIVPTPAVVRKVYLDAETGLIKNLKKGSMVFEMSTIDYRTVLDLNEAMISKGVTLIEAPCSGGMNGARAGTLTFMVGCSVEDLKRAEPYFYGMGNRIVHCGDTGKAQIVKVCNNMVLTATMAVTCEALHMASKAGIDPKVLSSVMSTSTGMSWSCNHFNPIPGFLPDAPSTNKYHGGFSMYLAHKDISLAMEMGKEFNAAMPVSACASQIYRHVIGIPGIENLDFSSLYTWYEQKHEEAIKEFNESK